MPKNKEGDPGNHGLIDQPHLRPGVRPARDPFCEDKEVNQEQSARI